jgi:hypothetical protein
MAKVIMHQHQEWSDFREGGIGEEFRKAKQSTENGHGRIYRQG